MDKRPSRADDDGQAKAGPSSGSTSAADSAAEVAALRSRLEICESGREAAEARAEWLRVEMQNDVRNMLATVRSIADRSFVGDEETGQHFRGRLDALARFEFGRGSERPARCDLQDMVSDELRTFEFDERISVAGPDVTLGRNIAWLIGLALHELATNSIKFGVLANSDPGAHLAIAWKSDGSRLTFEWNEMGVAIVRSAPEKFGFGREYIEQALPYQLGAATRFELKPGGVSCSIVTPLSQPGSSENAIRRWI